MFTEYKGKENLKRFEPFFVTQIGIFRQQEFERISFGRHQKTNRNDNPVNILKILINLI